MLVIGSAGFTGANIVTELLKTQFPLTIIDIDNSNDYYDISFKAYRLVKIDKVSEEHPDSKWTFIKGNIVDQGLIEDVSIAYNTSVVVNFAAQAGVRYASIKPSSVQI